VGARAARRRRMWRVVVTAIPTMRAMPNAGWRKAMYVPTPPAAAARCVRPGRCCSRCSPCTCLCRSGRASVQPMGGGSGRRCAGGCRRRQGKPPGAVRCRLDAAVPTSQPRPGFGAKDGE
jgi:hypothetical protein